MATELIFPVRKKIDHRGPLSIDAGRVIYFITIVAAQRGSSILLEHVDEILSSARFYQSIGRWFLLLFLVMPDHIHLLVNIPQPYGLARVIGQWKRFLASKKGIVFQDGFFDTRVRCQEQLIEKWDYILQNPVRKGLVRTPNEWPHVLGFDRETGNEIAFQSINESISFGTR